MKNSWVIIILIFIGIIILSLVYLSQKIKREKFKIEYFPIYGVDAQRGKEKINFYVPIPKNLSLIKKLKIIADQLSKFKFNGLPINVLRIEEKNNKKIAIIDLQETAFSDSKNFLPSWRTKYFQGSTGGYITTLTLTKSFLQEDYQGEWIDGIEFYYEGKPILEGEWDHITLYGTIYRFKNKY
ncbi:MAG: hypothetical protein N2323_04055 [candidate division WOR-3 bacterium]|nr:hypothetical protein [candidate division WOR-3 bacterium]MCX7837115.1 hypothetical protein [candidate division WOR-3 bacterium]MDW8113989.1 hypothetical protein [candidate division WOR-3 bacterium]